ADRRAPGGQPHLLSPRAGAARAPRQRLPERGVPDPGRAAPRNPGAGGTPMRIAITGGTGFVGRHLARALAAGGPAVVLVARGRDQRDEGVRSLPGVTLVPASVADPAALARAFEGCDAVAHCAGINREIGTQTYQAVHVGGTHHVVAAAARAGVQKVVLQ